MLTINALVEVLTEKGVLTQAEILGADQQAAERDEGEHMTRRPECRVTSVTAWVWPLSLALR